VAIVREYWPAFRERVEMLAGSLPAFVSDESETFATCGEFEQGFLVAQWRRCGDSLRVPLACKSRGVCPSCMGRRMCESAVLLVEHRLPAVPWRNWVLSFEGRWPCAGLRQALARAGVPAFRQAGDSGAA
jgi:hypothetical protein